MCKDNENDEKKENEENKDDKESKKRKYPAGGNASAASAPGPAAAGSAAGSAASAGTAAAGAGLHADPASAAGEAEKRPKRVLDNARRHSIVYQLDQSVRQPDADLIVAVWNVQDFGAGPSGMWARPQLDADADKSAKLRREFDSVREVCEDWLEGKSGAVEDEENDGEEDEEEGEEELAGMEDEEEKGPPSAAAAAASPASWPALSHPSGAAQASASAAAYPGASPSPGPSQTDFSSLHELTAAAPVLQPTMARDFSQLNEKITLQRKRDAVVAELLKRKKVDKMPDGVTMAQLRYARWHQRVRDIEYYCDAMGADVIVLLEVRTSAIVAGVKQPEAGAADILHYANWLGQNPLLQEYRAQINPALFKQLIDYENVSRNPTDLKKGSNCIAALAFDAGLHSAEQVRRALGLASNMDNASAASAASAPKQIRHSARHSIPVDLARFPGTETHATQMRKKLPPLLFDNDSAFILTDRNESYLPTYHQNMKRLWNEAVQLLLGGERRRTLGSAAASYAVAVPPARPVDKGRIRAKRRAAAAAAAASASASAASASSLAGASASEPEQPLIDRIDEALRDAVQAFLDAEELEESVASRLAAKTAASAAHAAAADAASAASAASTAAAGPSHIAAAGPSTAAGSGHGSAAMELDDAASGAGSMSLSLSTAALAAHASSTRVAAAAAGRAQPDPTAPMETGEGSSSAPGKQAAAASSGSASTGAPNVNDEVMPPFNEKDRWMRRIYNYRVRQANCNYDALESDNDGLAPDLVAILRETSDDKGVWTFRADVAPEGETILIRTRHNWAVVEGTTKQVPLQDGERPAFRFEVAPANQTERSKNTLIFAVHAPAPSRTDESETWFTALGELVAKSDPSKAVVLMGDFNTKEVNLQKPRTPKFYRFAKEFYAPFYPEYEGNGGAGAIDETGVHGRFKTSVGKKESTKWSEPYDKILTFADQRHFNHSAMRRASAFALNPLATRRYSDHVYLMRSLQFSKDFLDKTAKKAAAPPHANSLSLSAGI